MLLEIKIIFWSKVLIKFVMFVVEFVVFCILFDEDVEVVGFGMILFDEGC